MKKRLSYSIWAGFSNQDVKELNKIKRKFNFFKGPKFILHLTISSIKHSNKKKILQLLNLNQKNLNKFNINILNCEISDKFFESIYLKVKKNNEIKSFKKKIDNIFKIKKNKFSPHISLYYGLKTKEQKRKIINKLKNYKNKILLVNKIYLAINDEDNLRWKIVRKFNLY